MNPPDLGVSIEEETYTEESVSRHKPWFNGTKFFYTVKVLPPLK